jgi:signal peptidase
MGKQIVKAVNWAVVGLLAVVVGGLAFLYFTPGYNLYLVRSESMTPAINMGDLIITGPADSASLEKINTGTVVTYEYGRELVTHRVYAVQEAGLVTKGDAVEDPDPWTVSPSAVRGIYLFKVPHVGFLTNFVQTKLGWFLVIIIPSAVLVSLLVKDIIKEAFSNA